jgi:hypothetical protein
MVVRMAERTIDLIVKTALVWRENSMKVATRPRPGPE